MTITHYHSDLAASLVAKILGERKIIGIIKRHSAQLKGRKIHLHSGSQCAREARSTEIPASVPLGQELSYLTEQIEIRTSYLCLTVLHIPEGDHLSKQTQQPGIQSNQNSTIYSLSF